MSKVQIVQCKLLWYQSLGQFSSAAAHETRASLSIALELIQV